MSGFTYDIDDLDVNLEQNKDVSIVRSGDYMIVTALAEDQSSPGCMIRNITVDAYTKYDIQMTGYKSTGKKVFLYIGTPDPDFDVLNDRSVVFTMSSSTVSTVFWSGEHTSICVGMLIQQGVTDDEFAISAMSVTRQTSSGGGDAIGLYYDNIDETELPDPSQQCSNRGLVLRSSTPTAPSTSIRLTKNIAEEHDLNSTGVTITKKKNRKRTDRKAPTSLIISSNDTTRAFARSTGENTVIGTNSMIVGGTNNQVTGDFSGANVGYHNYVTGDFSLASGGRCNTITGDQSITLGGVANEIGTDNAVAAGGTNNVVNCPSSFICGIGNTLQSKDDTSIFDDFADSDLNARFVCGRYNNDTLTDTERIKLFMVGNGTSSSSKSNAFSVDDTGFAHISRGMLVGNADFAEYFESSLADAAKLVPGMVVSMNRHGKIEPCRRKNEAIGVISETACIVGDSYEEEWQGKYIKDEFGSHTKKISPEFDPTRKYVSRKLRPEWHVVGLVGKVHVLKSQQRYVKTGWVKLANINNKYDRYLIGT